MKRLILLTCMLLLAGCTPKTQPPTDNPTSAAADSGVQGSGSSGDAPETSAPSSEVVEISERLFIAQTNDIYNNPQEYLDKTIAYEGLFKTVYWDTTDETLYYVLRYGPGCCGNDGEAGFEIVWDGEIPQQNDWCKAVGKIEVYEQDGFEYLRLVLSSLTVLDERGQEFVST